MNINTAPSNIAPTISSEPKSRASEFRGEIDKAQGEELMEQAKAFEASFIAQALKFSGLEKAFTLGGGDGASAFTGFILEQLAEDIVESGGFGVAKTIYDQSIKK